MSKDERQILYRPQYAIEHVQKIRGLTPIRLFAILFPLWYVEVTGTRELQRPYALIERYLERGIAEADFHTAQELAYFFKLDSRLVEKILAFLEVIGHVAISNGRCALTDLGRRSLAADKKILPKETRQKLHFEAFHSRPLLREHYGHNLQIYSDLEADEITRTAKGGYQFQRLASFPDWDEQAVWQLERRPDRDLYNLPQDIRNLRPLNGEQVQVYLPMYIIETRNAQGRPYYVAYTHIRGRRDEFFEEIINKYTEIQRSLAAMETPQSKVAEIWRRSLAKRGLTQIQPEYYAGGVWRVILPAEAFQPPQESFPLAKLGDYHLEYGYFLHLWCDDAQLRLQAALNSIVRQIERRRKSITRQELNEHIQLITEKLQTRKPTLADVRAHAGKLRKSELLSTIDAL